MLDPAQPSPFWTFSLDYYRRPGVASACLVVQDSCDADINVLLFALWAGTRGRSLEAADMTRIVAAIAPWRQDVVLPLRAARRALKVGAAAIDAAAIDAPGIAAARASLRMSVKAAELEAERLQQEALYSSFPLADVGTPATPETAAPGNLACYAAMLAVAMPAAAVATLIDALRTAA